MNQGCICFIRKTEPVTLSEESVCSLLEPVWRVEVEAPVSMSRRWSLLSEIVRSCCTLLLLLGIRVHRVEGGPSSASGWRLCREGDGHTLVLEIPCPTFTRAENLGQH